MKGEKVEIVKKNKRGNEKMLVGSGKTATGKPMGGREGGRIMENI